MYRLYNPLTYCRSTYSCKRSGVFKITNKAFILDTGLDGGVVVDTDGQCLCVDGVQGELKV